MSYTLAKLAELCGGRLRGDGNTLIHEVATLQHARNGAISFLSNPHYRRYLAETSASAVILAPPDADACPVAALISPNPYLLYAKVADVLVPAPPMPAGVHASAVVHESVKVSATAWIGPGAILEEGVSVGECTFIGPNCVLQRDVQVGENCRLIASITLCHGVRVGKRAIIHPGVVIGADGFGFARDGETWTKVPQLGSVTIKDDVEIGANTTIDRGALEDTVIDHGVKLDNQIQIGHNAYIGEHTIIAGCSGISGSSRIGKRCMLGGSAGVTGHLEICDDVTITGMTVVSHSINEPGVYSGSMPMDTSSRWRKNMTRLRQLDELARRIITIEKKMKD
ncbi:MAG: UDP-3-O-(3-hydroxymyristoyl)glucosamine N-acyltransferase [Gammaproteobacteria bacterium]|nr:UDP-3-O-(3-hydroxymyristoyl)glucosamine N-acyltransferase [Gammaproteobacteria bacterium]